MDVPGAAETRDDTGSEIEATVVVWIYLLYCIKYSYFKHLTRFVSMNVMVNVGELVNSGRPAVRAKTSTDANHSIIIIYPSQLTGQQHPTVCPFLTRLHCLFGIATIVFSPKPNQPFSWSYFPTTPTLPVTATISAPAMFHQTDHPHLIQFIYSEYW